VVVVRLTVAMKASYRSRETSSKARKNAIPRRRSSPGGHSTQLRSGSGIMIRSGNELVRCGCGASAVKHRWGL
jgi:hypothetical protein